MAFRHVPAEFNDCFNIHRYLQSMIVTVKLSTTLRQQCQNSNSRPGLVLQSTVPNYTSYDRATFKADDMASRVGQ